MKVLKINPKDNVVVALAPINAGELLADGVTAVQAIPLGHKAALPPIDAGQRVIKYGYPVGLATQNIHPGEQVHLHNLRTSLSEDSSYRYCPTHYPLPQPPNQTFFGYLRPDGRAAVRNEVWIIPTVGCVNGVCRELARQAHRHRPLHVEGVYAFEHPYGCSQMGEDLAQTQRLLSSLCNNPNAAAVLLVSLGCENNNLQAMENVMGSCGSKRIRCMVCQTVADELVHGEKLLGELMAYANCFNRQPLPLNKLVVGMKCGGSDGLSGITANPAVGAFSDLLIAAGGSTILTEVPEMFGAEQILLNRCVTQEVYDKAAAMLVGFKQYFTNHGQTVYENPSPGNKDGGISTLEDKSLGCVQKGGQALVTDVLDYGAQLKTTGLQLLCGPGNDLVSATALTAAGAHLILFTTGRGTPFGAPSPTAKLSSNNHLATYKGNWIDWNAGNITGKEGVAQAGMELLDYVIRLASGEILTKAEELGYREISIWKDGVVL